MNLIFLNFNKFNLIKKINFKILKLYNHFKMGWILELNYEKLKLIQIKSFIKLNTKY